jgi:ABC-type branched-subunit amino acid transport system substrate-binding protein
MLTACKSAFASVGSMSAFDNGGAQVEDQCGIPDISAAAVTPEHQASKVTFAANSTQVGQVSSTVPGWIAEKYPQAVGKAAFLYINAGAAAVNAQADVKTYEQYGHGWKFVYTQPVDISTFNYAPFVQKMKQNGVRFVQWLGAYQEAVRLAQAMQQQGFKPDIFLLDPTGYSSDYVQSGGSAVDGTVVYLDSALFQDAGSNQEMATYITWLHRVAGSDAQPSYFGIYAWSAMLLFAQTAEKIGPDLTRAKLLAALKQVDNWTGNGLHSPQHVGPRQTPNCFAFIQLHGSSWSRLHPTTPTFDCRPDIGG